MNNDGILEGLRKIAQDPAEPYQTRFFVKHAIEQLEQYIEAEQEFLSRTKLVDRFVFLDPRNPEATIDDDSGTIIFASIDAGREWLQRNGYSDEEANNAPYLRSVGVCKKCGAPLFPSLLPDYAYQCFQCDEDFYAIEQGG